jgi:hypothetical protein
MEPKLMSTQIDKYRSGILPIRPEEVANQMLTLQDFQTILGDCHYPGFSFISGERAGDLFLQIDCKEAVDNDTGAPIGWKSRKWLVSRHSTKSEVVQTTFKAILTALEHEAR